MKHQVVNKAVALVSMFGLSASLLTTPMAGTTVAEAASTSRAAKQVEHLDRGLVAIKRGDGVYLSWRYLGTDSQTVGFNIYRNGVKINSKPVTDRTNYLDAKGTQTSTYYITVVENNSTLETSDSTSVSATSYFDIATKRPQGGKTPDNVSYTYTENDASVGDLDGDGEYELIVKWDPSNSKDNSQNGYTGNTILDAYKLDGTLLWRIDLGINIRSGAHYTQFMVFDFDGDGYSELICKTADGTKDGKGTYLGNRSADYRDSNGRILTGPEYLTLFDGRTGAAVHTINYEPARGKVTDWGDNYGNRCDRFLATVAYLDGKTPSVVMCRGYYAKSVLVAYDVVNKKLVKRWKFDSSDSGNSAYAGQGFHTVKAADVDNDGFDEIIYGACTIDHNGKGLYSTRLGHGDALSVGDFLPDRNGLEVFGCFETGNYGVALWDAATGKILFRVNGPSDTGRALAGNFIPGNSSAEFTSSLGDEMYDGSFKSVGSWSSFCRYSPNFAIYWDGDLEQEAFDKGFIDKYGKGRILTPSGTAINNGSKNNACLVADITGDWREEIVFRKSDGSGLRVYQTTAQTTYRIPTLMHDTQYRCQISSQNVAYNQPAHLSYFLGTGFALPKQPAVYAAKAMK